MSGCEPLIVRDGAIELLDQRKLPHAVEYVTAKRVEDVSCAIKEMVVRGAPLIGIVAAFGVYLGVKDAENKDKFRKALNASIESLSNTRPTAVNLFYALERMRRVAEEKMDILPVEKLINKLRASAFELWDMQKEQDKLIGKHGAEYLKGKRRILTHCNTGALATGGIGTALGIIKTMHSMGELDVVYVDETRPYLQGARLSAFELAESRINYKIVTDNSCGILMRKGLVDAVVVGADRIAKNGDTANKIGTYCLAVMASRHGVPFIVAAPESTIDRKARSFRDIPVEERSPEEVLTCMGVSTAPEGSDALNYSFDITDGELITAIVTEKGVYEKFEF